jgi:hypothetical protein
MRPALALCSLLGPLLHAVDSIATVRIIKVVLFIMLRILIGEYLWAKIVKRFEICKLFAQKLMFSYFYLFIQKK